MSLITIDYVVVMRLGLSIYDIKRHHNPPKWCNMPDFNNIVDALSALLLSLFFVVVYVLSHAIDSAAYDVVVVESVRE